MKSLFEEATLLEIKNRIEQLRPTTSAKWGRMTVAQMLAHATGGMKMAAGEIHLPRILLGRFLAPFIKFTFYNDMSLPKGINTDKALVISEQRDFEKEQQELLKWVAKFHNGGPTNCTKTPHPFLGKFTPEQWAKGMYKHLDHHLRQFGV